MNKANKVDLVARKIQVSNRAIARAQYERDCTWNECVKLALAKQRENECYNADYSIITK